MAKIKYTSDGIIAETECPYGHKSGLWITRINSYGCHRHCKFYRSTNYKEKYVICLADCSSQLEEILDKIDVVIANNKCDDICFEDFLSEIREEIAKILDGVQENARKEE